MPDGLGGCVPLSRSFYPRKLGNETAKPACWAASSWPSLPSFQFGAVMRLGLLSPLSISTAHARALSAHVSRSSWITQERERETEAGKAGGYGTSNKRMLSASDACHRVGQHQGGLMSPWSLTRKASVSSKPSRHLVVACRALYATWRSRRLDPLLPYLGSILIQSL